MASKRKKFSLAEDISRGLTEVIDTVGRNASSLRYEVISLSRIETDPENPRELLLTEKDLIFGISNDDSQAEKKKAEKKNLESLAETIKQHGIINPIMVYKHDAKYYIIAGERRFLATHIAGKTDIHAKVLDERPNETHLRALQWIENNDRQDLSLYERLRNLKAIAIAYVKQQNEAITARTLCELTGLSVPQAYNYLTVLNGPEEVIESIECSKINSLDKAVLISGVQNSFLREMLTEMASKGKSLKLLKETISKYKLEKQEAVSDTIGRKKTVEYVNLGKIGNTLLVKKMIEIVVQHSEFKKYENMFSDIRWDEHSSVSMAFKKLLSVLENA